MDLNEIYQTRPPFPLTYLNHIGEAIIHVNNDYCVWSYNNANSNQKTERVFSYELYHQFRLLMNSNEYNNEIRLDGEIGKRLHGNTVRDCGVIISNFNFNSTQIHFSPDLVIHKGQNDRQEINQKAIVEIKTKDVSNAELTKTILKLNHYIRVLHFQYAVFITVNTDFQEIAQKLRKLFHNPTNKELEKRFCRIIVMNYTDRKLTVYTLRNILLGNNNAFNYPII